MTSPHASLRILPLAATLLSIAMVVPALPAQHHATASTMAEQRPVNFTFDPASTEIHWTLNTNVHIVHGTFRLKSGSVQIDPATGTASGLIVIDAASGQSGEGARDKRMDSVVLETEKYPTITFHPTHVNGKVDLAVPGPITVDGIMNLHGQDHPMQLVANLQPNSTTVISKIHLEIPYVAWGMKDPSIMMFRCEKEVAIDIDATATQSPNVAQRPVPSAADHHGRGLD